MSSSLRTFTQTGWILWRARFTPKTWRLSSFVSTATVTSILPCLCVCARSRKGTSFRGTGWKEAQAAPQRAAAARAARAR